MGWGWGKGAEVVSDRIADRVTGHPFILYFLRSCLQGPEIHNFPTDNVTWPRSCSSAPAHTTFPCIFKTEVKTTRKWLMRIFERERRRGRSPYTKIGRTSNVRKIESAVAITPLLDMSLQNMLITGLLNITKKKGEPVPKTPVSIFLFDMPMTEISTIPQKKKKALPLKTTVRILFCDICSSLTYQIFHTKKVASPRNSLHGYVFEIFAYHWFIKHSTKQREEPAPYNPFLVTSLQLLSVDLSFCI